MKSTMLLYGVLLAFVVGHGCAWDEEESVIEKRSADVDSQLSYLSQNEVIDKPRLRRSAAYDRYPPGRKTSLTRTKRSTKQSLFDKIMSRATQIRRDHPSHHRTSVKKTTTKRTTYRRPYSYRKPPTYRKPHTYRKPSTHRKPYTYRKPYRRPTTHHHRKPTYRRPTTRRTNVPKKPSNKKHSLFHKIMSRVTQIREQHDSHKKPPTYKRPVVRRPTTTNNRGRPPVERPPTRRAKPVSRWSTRRKPIEKVPHKHTYKRPVEKVPHKHTYKRPIERKPTSTRGRPPIERPPTRRVRPSKPIVPKKVVPKKKASLFHRIMNRVTDIRKNHPHTHSVVRKPTIPKWTPRVSTRTTNGLHVYSLQSRLNKAHNVDEKNIMKILTWNVFEGKTLRSHTHHYNRGRKEICDKLKRMKPAVFGLQGASTQQVDYIRGCLPSYHYSYYRGRGRYDWTIRKYLYNPVFYMTHEQVVKSKGSGTISARGKRGSAVVIATYTKILFSSKVKGHHKPTAKKNNIKKLWSRLNDWMNNPKQLKTTKTGGAETEVLIVNTNLDAHTPALAKQQIDTLLRQVRSLSQYWNIPVILMGDLKVTEKSSMYKSIIGNNFENTLNKLKNKHAYPTARRHTSNHVIDYILETKLDTIFAATIIDRLRTRNYKPSSQRPIFAAFKMP